MKIALFIVVIVLAIALVLTLVAGSTLNAKYSSKKSFSSLSWIYALLTPVIIIVIIIATIIF